MSQDVMILVIFYSPDKDNFAYIFISGFKIYIYIYLQIYIQHALPRCVTDCTRVILKYLSEENKPLRMAGVIQLILL